MEQKTWTQEQINDIIFLYKEKKMTIRCIASKYKTKCEKISYILKENGVKIIHRPTVEKELNEDYFETIDTEEKAYLLGFITADGCVIYRKDRKTKSGVFSIQLAIKDVEIINKIKDVLHSNSKISYDKRDKKEAYGIKISSTKLVDDLGKYGVVPNKTYVMKKIYTDFEDKELLRHYLRGLLDGNGCISHSTNKNNWYIYICGYNKSFIQSYQNAINELIDISVVKVINCKTAYRCVWNGERAKKVAELLYKNATIFLTRKHSLAEELLGYKKTEDIV